MNAARPSLGLAFEVGEPLLMYLCNPYECMDVLTILLAPLH